MIAKKKLLQSYLMALIGIIIFTNLNCSEKEVTFKVKDTVDPAVHNNIGYYTDSSANSMNSPEEEKDKDLLVFIGTYTWGSPKGIYVYKLDTTTGSLSYVSESPNASNPSYLAIHSGKRWVYAVNENSSGTISAYAFDTITQQLSFINSVSAEGNAPCYISIDNTGKYVLVANYNSGNVTVCPINADGSLGTAVSTDQHTGSGLVAGRQEGPHAHMIMQAANNFIYNTDLGIDKIVIYNLDANSGTLTSAGNDASSVAGAGPRHISFHPAQPWAYVICELSGTIESYNVNNVTGEMTRFDTISTLPEGVTAAAASADIHITPDGKYLYASNRGSNNNIAMYSIHQSTGKLILLGHQAAGGATPRNFAIDPSGKFLLVASQDDNKVITFRIDQETGLLISTGQQINVPNPVCLKFLKIYKEHVTTGIREYTE